MAPSSRVEGSISQSVSRVSPGEGRWVTPASEEALRAMSCVMESWE